MKPLRPYLYHAYYNWILDNDYTPYLLVDTTYPDVDVPQEFIQNNKIILNISARSIGQYLVNDDYISFEARFHGMLRQIFLPFGAIEAIYSQEKGDGVMFQEEEYYSAETYLKRKNTSIENTKLENTSPKKKISHLKLVK